MVKGSDEIASAIRTNLPNIANEMIAGEGRLAEAAKTAIQNELKIVPKLSVTGSGTTDGRFVVNLGAEVLEVGPLAGTIHGPDEHVPIWHLDALHEIYFGILERLLL